jgi:two-component sensor histidine kinase
MRQASKRIPESAEKTGADRYDEEQRILERIRRGERVEHYETVRQCKHGRLIDISLTVSPVRNIHGEVIGASKIARDITGRKRSEAQIAILAREAEHRAKNVLATVLATVHLSRSDTPDGLKRVIEGRIQALANVHRLFVESRWTGADLRSVVTQELSPYSHEGDGQARIEGPHLTVEPDAAQAIAVTLHELATNAAKYGALSVPDGYVHVGVVARGRRPNRAGLDRGERPRRHATHAPRLRHARDGEDDHRSTGGAGFASPGARKGSRAKSPSRRESHFTTASFPLTPKPLSFLNFGLSKIGTAQALTVLV